MNDFEVDLFVGKGLLEERLLEWFRIKLNLSNLSLFSNIFC